MRQSGGISAVYWSNIITGEFAARPKMDRRLWREFKESGRTSWC
jgi:hypothetical protein